LTPEQRCEVERLKGQVIRLGEVIQELLTPAVTLQAHAIEKVLGKRDMEVAFDVLSGKLKP